MSMHQVLSRDAKSVVQRMADPPVVAHRRLFLQGRKAMMKKGFIARLREDWSKGGFSLREQCCKAWALFRLVIKDQRNNIYFFSFLGLALTISMVVLPSGLSKGLTAIYSEHLAFKTIGLLFAVCAILWAVLYPFQRKNVYVEGEEWFAFKVINVPAKFGEDLCAVAFGMLLVPGLVMATQDGLLEAIKILALQCSLLIFATLFRKTPKFIYSQELKTDHPSIDLCFYAVIMVGGLFTAYQAIVMT
ncbi:hypothetical protein [Pseudomonas sp. PS02290]|uniref:hypothetical protein n=1 Tax=Pseudomonas sp. PS02290 TaxID=2991430 RepID=UPI00249A85C9|nr:hypothetical protein [Pseudomonas sp. PS02290]